MLQRLIATGVGRWLRSLLGLCLLLCGLPLAALAQTLPQQPPVDAGRLLQEQRRLEQLREEPAAPSAVPLTTRPAAVAPAQARLAPAALEFNVRQFVLSGTTAVDTDALQAVLAPYLNRPLTLADLRKATGALEQRILQAGFLAQATLPPQDVTEGVVRIDLAEARFGAVQRAERADAGDPIAPRLAAQAQGLVAAQLVPGEPLNLQTLQSALLLADDLPGVSVAGSLQAGTIPGSTDVLLQLAPTPRVRTELVADNAANRATGEERLSVIITLDSALGLGDRSEGLLSTTRGTQYGRAAFSLPVGNRGLRLGAHGSLLQYRVLENRNTTPGLAPDGDGSTIGLDGQAPLVRSATARWDARFGMEHTRQRNRDDTVTLGNRDTTSRSRTTVWNLGLAGQRVDHIGRGGVSQASAQISAGKLSLKGSPQTLLQGDARTADTAGRYAKLRFSLARLQSITASLSLQASLTGQLASKNLDPSEKFYLGGVGAVNAYPSGEAGGSSGAVLNLELRQQLGAHWQVSGLLDVGHVQQFQNNTRADGGGPLVANNGVTLKGVGASLNWQPTAGVQVKATYAHRIGSNPLATAAGTDTDGSHHKHRVWLSASLAF
ncbi:MAG: ShlB/FhaC/HecB family hemolysin secretion/activation protein [Pseudomonadota bacterium]|nr:ShlB/FhaC/HecB family hemolysin secretion/activation protein [Pseudomonadota bacterium]